MKTFVRFLAVATLCTALAGCLPEAGSGERAERQDVQRNAQAEGLARSLSVVGSRVHGAFMTETASPFVAAVTAGGVDSVPTQLIDYRSAFAMDLGPAGELVNVGFCNDSGADARRSLVVWLNSSDTSNRFNPKGLGDGATGTVMSRLAEMTDPASIGVVEGTNIALRNGDALSLGACAATFNIPVGAPVMVFANLQEPDVMEVATTRTETRTLACPSVGGVAQTGTLTQTRTVTVAKDGSETPSDPGTGWVQIAEMCSSDVANVANVNIGTSHADLLGSLGAALGGVSQGDLRNALETLDDDECRNNTVTETRIDPQTGEPVEVTYNTCEGSDTEYDRIDELELSQDYTTTTENVTGPCTASTSNGGSTLSVNIAEIGTSLTGYLTTRPWQPNPNGAVYERETRHYTLTNPDGTTTPTTLRGALRGLTLDCRREEIIHFTTESFAPSWGGIASFVPASAPGGQRQDGFVNPANLTLTNADGVDYTRVATVNGWANAETMIPNGVDFGPWSRSSISGEWLETISEPVLCQATGEQGLRVHIRTHTLTGYRTVDSGPWSSNDNCPPPCAPTETYQSQACPSGQTGTITQVRTTNVGGQCGLNGSWAESSNTCQDVPDECAVCGTESGSCQVGTPTSPNCNPMGYDGDNYMCNWTCTSGTTSANCQAVEEVDEPPVPAAQCSTTANTCTVGTPSNYSPGNPTSTWTCTSGTTTANCSATSTPPAQACSSQCHAFNPTTGACTDMRADMTINGPETPGYCEYSGHAGTCGCGIVEEPGSCTWQQAGAPRWSDWEPDMAQPFSYNPTFIAASQGCPSQPSAMGETCAEMLNTEGRYPSLIVPATGEGDTRIQFQEYVSYCGSCPDPTWTSNGDFQCEEL